jgi:hypothetical protein
MMKRMGVLAYLLLVTLMASGQVVIREQIRVRDTLFIDKYEVSGDLGAVAQLKMNLPAIYSNNNDSLSP